MQLFYKASTNRLWRWIMVMMIVWNLSIIQAVAQERYKLSMLPLYSPEEINKRIVPLANQLSNSLKVKIETVVAKDFIQYERRIQSGEINIAYSNPMVYVRIATVHEALVVAADKEGTRFRGLIITRMDSPLKKLLDLKGKTVSIVGLTSAGGYLSQRMTLLEEGLDTKKDMRLVEALDNKQENVILSVYQGDVDAGFIRESALNSVDAYVPPTQIKVLAKTAWLPNWVISVSQSLSPDLKEAIRKSLVSLKADDPVLKAMGIRRFEVTTDQDFADLRKVVDLN